MKLWHRCPFPTLKDTHICTHTHTFTHTRTRTQRNTHTWVDVQAQMAEWIRRKATTVPALPLCRVLPVVAVVRA